MTVPLNGSATETTEAARTSLPPARTYSVPGGPAAKSLAEIEVYKLAEIARGGPNDNPR